VTIYLLRHARAGRRSAWKGDDEHRPLSKVGRRQASGLVDILSGAPIEQLVSSPHIRCVQTVEPLAHNRDLEVDVVDELREGASRAHARCPLEKVSGHPTVLCTHGDVVEALLTHFKGNGVKVGKLRMEKGSVWALDTRNGRVTKATYLPPPKS
jgi:broad specificity phosphatase PhoE